MIALYTENKAYIRIDVAISGSFQVRKGVKQGCVLLPLLFNVCREWILKKVMENWDGGHNRKEKDLESPICRRRDAFNGVRNRDGKNSKLQKTSQQGSRIKIEPIPSTALFTS